MPKPKINIDKCLGEGTCSEECQVEVYKIKRKKSIVINPEACIGCRACEIQCPTGAITIKE